MRIAGEFNREMFEKMGMTYLPKSNGSVIANPTTRAYHSVDESRDEEGSAIMRPVRREHKNIEKANFPPA